MGLSSAGSSCRWIKMQHYMAWPRLASVTATFWSLSIEVINWVWWLILGETQNLPAKLWARGDHLIKICLALLPIIETTGEKSGFRVNIYFTEICLRGFCQSGRGGLGGCTWHVGGKTMVKCVNIRWADKTVQRVVKMAVKLCSFG